MPESSACPTNPWTINQKSATEGGAGQTLITKQLTRTDTGAGRGWRRRTELAVCRAPPSEEGECDLEEEREHGSFSALRCGLTKKLNFLWEPRVLFYDRQGKILSCKNPPPLCLDPSFLFAWLECESPRVCCAGWCRSPGDWFTCVRTCRSRLRQRDIGPKTHLDQLDLQINKLQLDLGPISGEAPDSDSRPSSGFYELSDGGSCSLSTSCASVCSDRVSPSMGSLLPVAQAPKARPSMGDWRPRSVDETAVPAWRPQATQEGDKPPGTLGEAGQPSGTFWPRPVSTGDLDRALLADTGLQKAGPDPELLRLLCQGADIPLYMLDPKYRQDLVSKGGREVYPYPSPLHAVALQSPLFVLTKETLHGSGPSSPRKAPLGPAAVSTVQTGLVLEAGPARARAYIDRLLRLWGRETPAKGSGGEQGPQRHAVSPPPQRQGGWSADGGGRLKKLVFAPGREDEGGPAPRRGASRGGPQQQGPMPLESPQHPGSLPEEKPQPSNHCVLRETMAGPASSSQAQLTPPAQDCGHDNRLPSRRLDESPPPSSGHFAHLPFAASKPSPPWPKTGPPKSKAEKMKRRPTDKVLRFAGQPPLRLERLEGAQAATQLSLEWDSAHWPPGRGVLQRRLALAWEVPGRSCSESTLYPMPVLVPLTVAPQESQQTSAQALFPVEATLLTSAARRKHGRWQSTVDISGRARLAGYPESNLGPPRPTARRVGGPQARGRPALVRQDAHTRSDSEPSKHSAECDPRFPSVILETSEGEASEHSTSRFADHESGSSDGEGGARSRDCDPAMGHAAAGHRELAWPQVGLVSSRSLLSPVPKLCRIKASKALKKKIRRFQPTALKVMTTV
ncbi:dapper homolog 2 isoform X1 [Saimiri boliviensis]|uniref:dapper homolog 2 isoform X1 n=1 Tax=Saimiri boliviensis TaxID=27679 RepID=UPI00193DEAC7|nr:dapper homolog 2 isoform X1 [Saimiri boliviensis boliviensis]